VIGHYLLTLTAEQEDRVLTRKMRPGSYLNGCLISTVCGGDLWAAARARTYWHAGVAVEGIYDNLCERFGVTRINMAIRNRILANKARRELAGVREMASI
jgi:hypothetical protein